jgi:hypothetical protein
MEGTEAPPGTAPGSPAPGSAGAASGQRATKACRFCGERILAVARKCKHCGSYLTGPPAGRAGGARGVSGSAPDSEGTVALVCGIIGVVTLCFPLVPVILGGVAISKGIQARQRNPSSGPGTAGLVLGIISLILGLLYLPLFVMGMIGSALEGT